MDPRTKSSNEYVLGSAPEELARLDRQAAQIGPAMRVLDLGTGLGHMARMVAELVGPTGGVVGIDRSAEALAVARERTQAAGATHVTFHESDVTSWRDSNAFDAVVERLVLFHVADPIAVVRHHRQNLRPGGVFVAVDFDIGSSRSEPRVELMDEALGWIVKAFRSAGASPNIGARLGVILERAGLSDVTTFGVQGYVPPTSRAGASLLGSVVRSLAPAIVRGGIATEDQLDLANLEDRMAEEFQRADAVMLPPTVVGAWGRSH